MAELLIVHPTLGTARLLRTLDDGQIWEVRFDQSGRRFKLPASQFVSPSPADAGRSMPDNRELLRRFHHRQALEALRMGIVPIVDIKELTIGLDSEKTKLEKSFDLSKEVGGDVIVVLADYGFGKSHFIEMAAQEALTKNFLVASASLDLIEVPPGKAREIYKALVASLRYPGHEVRGLEPLLNQALANPNVLRAFLRQRPISDDPLCAALEALVECQDADAREAIIEWIGGTVTTLGAAAKPYLKHAPKLYVTGEVARQYTYLLTGLSVLATALGYSGLAVLIDESEHYALLRKTQHDRADSFFKSMIYAATEPEARRVELDSIPNHTRTDYPITYATPTNMFFMFASTNIEGQRLPVESWLAPAQIIQIDPRFTKAELMRFGGTVLRYHGIAYGYSPHESRYKPLLEGIAAQLSEALNKHKAILREAIKLTVTACDLMYVYPDYQATDFLDEMARGRTS